MVTVEAPHRQVGPKKPLFFRPDFWRAMKNLEQTNNDGRKQVVDDPDGIAKRYAAMRIRHV